MAYRHWKKVSEFVVPFAGAPHYASLSISVDHDQHGLCSCKSLKGLLVKIVIEQLLGKDRKPCGHHSAQKIKQAVLDHFAHQSYRCIDCLQQPPFVT